MHSGAFIVYVLTATPLVVLGLLVASLSRSRQLAIRQWADVRAQLWEMQQGKLLYEYRIKQALGYLERHGQTDENHHRAWVIDQVARSLLGPDYDEWVKEMRAGEDGPNTYDYSVGIAP